ELPHQIVIKLLVLRILQKCRNIGEYLNHELSTKFSGIWFMGWLELSYELSSYELWSYGFLPTINCSLIIVNCSLPTPSGLLLQALHGTSPPVCSSGQTTSPC